MKEKDLNEEEIKAVEDMEDTAEEVVEESPEDEVETLREKVKALEEEAAQAKDRMLRNQAELENFKKRLIREREDAVIDEGLEHETVVEELQKGYRLHDRVIRPAKVKIAKPC